LPTLTGFENHGGVTTVGPGARPLARVAAGVGNGSGDGTEGAWAGRVVGTYLHGPVLARNPALADVLLGWAIGRRLDPRPDDEEQALRRERLATVRRATRGSWFRAGGRRGDGPTPELSDRPSGKSIT
jgi:CobQ-like glutamine amidotransferase family enzyme